MRDPWRDDFPLRGFTRLRDAASGRTCTVFFGKREAARYRQLALEREERLQARFHASGWRFGIVDGDDPRRGLYEAFGIA